jgi:cell division transport system ATP-binding protein
VVYLDSVTISQRSKIILSDIGFKVNPGEFVFLIGKTGSGKSSLIKVLYGEIFVDQGKGNVVGFDLNNLNKNNIHLLRRKIGIVFQDFKLLQDMTIFENMNFVLKATGWKDKNKINERINKVLTLVSIEASLEKYPFELSGGEQQRVAIARALLNNPKLIIADEPTGNLDPETSESIMGLLKNLNEKGITILMATHDYNMIVKFPGKIFKCEKGEVFEVITKRN